MTQTPIERMRTPSDLWRQYLAWSATNLGLFYVTGLAAFAVMFLILVLTGVPPASPTELALAVVLSPILLMTGPGLVIVPALLALIAYSSARGTGRIFAVVASTAGGVLWVALFGAPALANGTWLVTQALAFLVPWTLFGFVVRLWPRRDARGSRDIPSR